MPSSSFILLVFCLLGVSGLLSALLAGPLRESDMLWWALLGHVLLVVLLLLSRLLRRDLRNCFHLIRVLASLNKTLVMLSVFFLVSLILSHSFVLQQFDFSSDRRFQISQRLSDLLTNKRMSKLSLIVLSGSQNELTQKDLLFLDMLKRGDFSRVDVSEVSILERPDLIMKQGLAASHKALVALKIEDRIVEVALTELSEKAFLETLSPLLEPVRQIAVYGSSIDELLSNKELVGLSLLKERGLAKGLNLVPFRDGEWTSFNALLIIVTSRDSDPALIQLLRGAQSHSVPTILLCEPNACLSRDLHVELGLEIGTTVLIDRMPLGQNTAEFGLTLVFDNFTANAVTGTSQRSQSLLSHGLTTLHPLTDSNSVEGPSDPSLVRWTPILLASETGWGETNAFGEAGRDKKVIGLDSKDRVGKLMLAAFQTRDFPLLVFGDTDWLRNQFLPRNSNWDVFLEAMNWLSGNKSIGSSSSTSSRVLSVRDFERFLLLAIVVPEFFLIMFFFLSFVTNRAKESR